MSTDLQETTAAYDPRETLAGRRVLLVGRFASVSNRETAAAIQRRGGVLDEAHPDWIVLGEESTTEEIQRATHLATALQAEQVAESELWRRLGLVDDTSGVRRLYSPAMLADLVSAPTMAIRRWTRRGALQPTCWVNRLAYFDFHEARIAKLLAELLRQQDSLSVVDRCVDRLVTAYPELQRPLSELPLTVVDGDLMIREEERLAEAHGQRLLEFSADASDSDLAEEDAPTILSISEETTSLRDRAWEFYEEGDLGQAIEAWRLAMLESPPTADEQFTFAEWLDQAGELQASRERYYAALELDSEHLEARVGLGRVLAQIGEYQLALAALRGAIQQHEDFAEAHYHLGRLLDSIDAPAEAEAHWRRFLEIAPDSPWSEEARHRLAGR